MISVLHTLLAYWLASYLVIRLIRYQAYIQCIIFSILCFYKEKISFSYGILFHKMFENIRFQPVWIIRFISCENRLPERSGSLCPVMSTQLYFNSLYLCTNKILLFYPSGICTIVEVWMDSLWRLSFAYRIVLYSLSWKLSHFS